MASAAVPQVLECVVSPEWAVAVAGVSTGHLQGALARLDLWQEFQLLEKLMYKNANQHGGSEHFKRLQEVRRLLRLLRDMQLERQVQAFHAAFHASKQKGSLPTGSVLMAYGGDRRHVPSHGAAAAVLRSLQAACHLIEQLGPAVHRASLQLLAQLAHSFFMPLCLTSLAALARIQVLSGQLMLDAVRTYNVLSEAAALLPHSTGAAGTGTAAAAVDAAAGATGQLPQMLRAQWKTGLPHLECIPCPEGESLAEQAAAACSKYGLHLVPPEPEGGAAVESAIPVQCQLPGRRQQRGKQAQAQAPPVLAVVEDRGMPISREAFAAAMAPTAPTAVAAATAAAAAADAMDVDASALLDVVEDGVPSMPAVLPAVEEAEVAPLDARGEVASLMAGEVVGHVYRRSTVLGMLGQGLALGKPANKAGKQKAASSPKEEALAQPAAASVAGEGTVPAPAAADAGPAPSAEPAVPAAAAEARTAGPKPAFVSVRVGMASGAAQGTALGAEPAVAAAAATGAPGAASSSVPKPAFLSVAAPAAKAASSGAKTAFTGVSVPNPASSSGTAAAALIGTAGSPTGAATAAVASTAGAAQPGLSADPPAQPAGQPFVGAAQAAETAPRNANAAPPAPAAGATVQPETSLALATGGARKRKKASAAGAAQQQQATASVAGAEAAGAAKSWEDWLEPLATTSAASTASVGAGKPNAAQRQNAGRHGRQQQQQQQLGKRRRGK